MPYSLIRMKRIISGVCQLFTSMDKGFARVESDLTLLTRFRHICYESNVKLEESLLKLEELISNSDDYTSSNSEIKADSNADPAPQISPEIINELINAREIISDSILMITDYIDEFAELWKKSFSLNALEKFRNLIINEFNQLENEIDMLQMSGIIGHREAILKKSAFTRTISGEIKKD